MRELSLRDAAAYFGLSVRTIERRIRANQYQTVKHEGRTFVLLPEIVDGDGDSAPPASDMTDRWELERERDALRVQVAALERECARLEGLVRHGQEGLVSVSVALARRHWWSDLRQLPRLFLAATTSGKNAAADTDDGGQAEER